MIVLKQEFFRHFISSIHLTFRKSQVPYDISYLFILKKYDKIIIQRDQKFGQNLLIIHFIYRFIPQNYHRVKENINPFVNITVQRKVKLK